MELDQAGCAPPGAHCTIWLSKDEARAHKWEKHVTLFYNGQHGSPPLCRLITVNDRRYQKTLLYKKPQSIKQFCLQQMHLPFIHPRLELFYTGGGGGGGAVVWNTVWHAAVSFLNSHVWLCRRHTRSSSCAIYSFSETALRSAAGCMSNTCSSMVRLAGHWDGHVLLPPFLPITFHHLSTQLSSSEFLSNWSPGICSSAPALPLRSGEQFSFSLNVFTLSKRCPLHWTMITQHKMF